MAKTKKKKPLLNPEQIREKNRLYMRVYRSQKRILKLKSTKPKGYKAKLIKANASLKSNKQNFNQFKKDFIVRGLKRERQWKYRNIPLGDLFIEKIKLLRKDLYSQGIKYSSYTRLISDVFYHIRYMLFSVRDGVKYKLSSTFTSVVSNYFYVMDDEYYLNSGHDIVERFVFDNGRDECIMYLRDVLGMVHRFKNYLNYNEAISKMYSVVWYGIDDYFKDYFLESPILYVPVTSEVVTKSICIDFYNSSVSMDRVKDFNVSYFKKRTDDWRRRIEKGK